MRALCDTLEYEGYKTYGFTAPAEALAAMRERSYDLLLADLQMPGTNGIDLMKSAQLIDPTLVAVIMTGHGALETAIAAMKAGALDYIQKPIKLATTLPVLERALAVRQLRIEKKAPRRECPRAHRRAEDRQPGAGSLLVFRSHDLRSPLRAVSVFTQSLISDHAASLSEEGRRLLQNVNAGAAHMDRLITDLLRLSQLNRQALHKQPVKFGELAERVIADMANERAGRSIEFVIADFPTWQVDPGLMQQVFVNLISNAIKFTREREKARIEIGFRMDGDTMVCFVKDNGVGFNMKYMNKLFGVFQRLHSAISSKARAWDSPSCAELSSATGARSGSTAARIRARRSSSACRLAENHCYRNRPRGAAPKISIRPRLLGIGNSRAQRSQPLDCQNSLRASMSASDTEW
jgi:signal transduction histidine kinase